MFAFTLTALAVIGIVMLLGMASHGDPGFYDPKTLPTWFKDFTSRQTVLPGGVTVNAALFPRIDAVTVTVDGASAEGDTETTVLKTTGVIPKGVQLAFANGNVVTTSQTPKGSTTVEHTAAPAGGIADAETVTYEGQGARSAQQGTLIGRTYAERAAADDFGPFADGDDEVYLLMHTYRDLDTEKWVDVARPGALIAENFLPGWGDRPAAEKAAIRAAYTTTIGQP